MISFMFGVLGSFIFWGGFFIVGMFAGTFTLKKIAPSCYKYIITQGKVNEDYLDVFEVVFIIMAIYLFWPFIVVCLGIWFLSKLFIAKPFCTFVKFIDKNTPTVSFNQKGKD